MKPLVFTADDLRDVAESTQTPLDVVERDFLLVTIAGELTAAFPGALCFKGGFVLRHAYGQRRMSKDIDATRFEPPKHKLESGEVKRVITGSCREHFRLRVSEPETASGRSLDFADIKYTGPCGGRGTVAVEVSYREAVVLPAVVVKIGEPYYAPFEIPVLDPREAVAEKLRALAQRLRPTDLSDIAFLLVQRRVDPEPDVMRALVAEKFRFVGGNHLQRVRENVGRLQAEYDRSAKELAPDALDFDIAAKAVLRRLEEWLGRR